MGDISAEPSMEDILSSIKRIIAEEGDAAPVQQQRRVPRAAPQPLPRHQDDDDADLDAVLELKNPIPAVTEEELPRAVPSEPAQPVQPAAEPVATVAPTPIVSSEAASATRGSLEALSRLMVKPEPASDGTLEGLVREMLRPMLAEWLDAKLPPMVEAMVKGEIARITGQR